jgi:hypothetical protein
MPGKSDTCVGFALLQLKHPRTAPSNRTHVHVFAFGGSWPAATDAAIFDDVPPLCIIVTDACRATPMRDRHTRRKTQGAPLAMACVVYNAR